jgi:predicted metal-dependent phosphoesterase TrpH
MAAPRFDLQSHSTHSDGELGAADVVVRAAEAGVELLALSDHDTVDGVDEALAAGERHGVRVVPAAELSAVYESAEDLHVLGYGIDHHDPVLLERLQEARGDREARAARMADRLEELGLAVDQTALDERRAAGKPIGRPHLAAAAFGAPENRDRVAREGLEDASALLVAYLIPGAPAYAPRTRPTVAEAIGWIHDAGGLAVWAHPFWDVDADAAVITAIDEFAAAGLDGAEAFYVTHNEAQTRLVATACAERGLLSTGSSDFHGPSHRLFSRFLAHELYGLSPELGRIADG